LVDIEKRLKYSAEIKFVGLGIKLKPLSTMEDTLLP